MTTAETPSSLIWMIRLIALFLLALLGYMLLRIIITVSNPESVWRQPTLGEAQKTVISSQTLKSFSFITDPFNRDITVVNSAIVEIGEDAPETTLNLKLTGRTAGPNGSAILRTPDNNEASYSLDDEIVPGVTLQAVNKDYIVLSVDGQLQRLTFEQNDDLGLNRKTESEPTRTAKSAVTADNINDLFQNVSLKRVMKNGSLQGYTVRANRTDISLSDYGFEKDDIITSIGSTDITRGRPDFVALLSSAVKSGGVDMTVVRNDQQQIIRLGAQ